jgi:hypothetical protein
MIISGSKNRPAVREATATLLPGARPRDLSFTEDTFDLEFVFAFFAI